MRRRIIAMILTGAICVTAPQPALDPARDAPAVEGHREARLVNDDKWELAQVRIPAESFEMSAKLPAGGTTLTLKAVANAASGEKVGDTSQFEAQSDALKGVVGFDAGLKQLVVRGKTYSNIPFHVGKTGADKKP